MHYTKYSLKAEKLTSWKTCRL